MSDKNSQKTDETQHTPCERPQISWLRKCCDPIVALTAVLAGSTIGLWIESSRTTAVLLAGQRAWLTQRDIEPLNPNWADGRTYTEISLPFENTGKEPARNVAQNIQSGTLATSDFRRPLIVRATILDMLGGKSCDSTLPNNEDVAVFPGAKDTQLLPFTEVHINKTRAKTHFPIVVGCVVYKISDGSVHRTEFCGILEPIGDAPYWRSITCLTGNRAN